MAPYISEVKAQFAKLKQQNGTTSAKHRGKVHALSWNSTGTKLASCSADKSALLSVVNTNGELVKDVDLIGHTGSVDQLDWCPTNEHLLATCAADKTVRIWDARVGNKAVHVVKTKGENINVSWSPDGETIAVGSKDDEMSFISTKSNTVERRKQFSLEVNEIGWSKTGDLFLASTSLGSISALEWPSLTEPFPPLMGHMSSVMCLEFDPVGKFFATGGADALVGIWDASELVCVQMLNCSDYPVRGLSFSFDGQLIAAASEDQSLKLTHVESGETVHKLDCPDGTFCVSWHPRSLVLAYAGEEKDNNNRDAGMITLFGG